MGLTWTDDPKPDARNQEEGEHPVVALLAVLAIVLAILLIMWARVEVHGTADLKSALAESRPEHATVPPPEAARSEEQREVDEAVTSSRFATGFSP
jgi:hypothetical protein